MNKKGSFTNVNPHEAQVTSSVINFTNNTINDFIAI